MVTVPLIVHENGEKKTVGSAKVETPKTPFDAVTVTATVNDVEVAKAIQGSTLTGLSIAPAETHVLTPQQAVQEKVYASLRKFGVSGPDGHRIMNDLLSHGIRFVDIS